MDPRGGPQNKYPKRKNPALEVNNAICSKFHRITTISPDAARVRAARARRRRRFTEVGVVSQRRARKRVMRSRRPNEEPKRREEKKTTFDWSNFHAGIMHAVGEKQERMEKEGRDQCWFRAHGLAGLPTTEAAIRKAFHTSKTTDTTSNFPIISRSIKSEGRTFKTQNGNNGMGKLWRNCARRFGRPQSQLVVGRGQNGRRVLWIRTGCLLAEIRISQSQVSESTRHSSQR